MYKFIIAVFLSLCLPQSVFAEERGIVTFTVDNILRDFKENRFPVFQQYNLPGTLYVQTRPVGVDNWDMDWDDLRVIHSAGWEIGAHSYSHEIDLTKATEVELELELGAPAAAIYREIGVYPKTFATPFGAYDDRVLERARVYYDSHLGAWGNGGINPVASTDHYRVNRVEVERNDSPAYVCERIAQVGHSGDWLVLMLHGIVDGEPGEYEISHQSFEAILACTAQMVEDGVVRVLTAAHALNEIPHTPLSN